MPIIRVLPEQLANRIAAGEVVERPSSVVKELVENSIDAGADRIEIEIEGGGTRLIRVVDNGSGMDEDDALLCFERHGTSKIKVDKDLDGISTLGFRGEAIPSIASVSKMSIISRLKDSALGNKVEFEYGRLVKVHEIGCSQGSIVEVRNLFGRTPARKKFLRTKRTELGHIDEIVKNYALACPGIAFSLRIDGRENFMANVSDNLEERLRSILNYRDELIDIESGSRPLPARRLNGFLVPPEKPLRGTARLRLFINGRAIKDRLMHHAVIEGLRSFLLKGHTPSGYLHLQVSPDEVDVNVHPAKHEVRFRNSRDIHQFIKQNIQLAMQKHQTTLRSHFISRRSTIYEETAAAQSASSAQVDFPGAADISPHTLEVPKRYDKKLPAAPAEITQMQQPAFTETGITPRSQVDEHADQSKKDAPPPFQFSKRSQRTQANMHHGMRIIGQFSNLYIFCQRDENLIAIDQHAAHERLLYEKFRKQYMEGKVASQSLLFPETVELSPFQIELVENNMDELLRMGFSVSEFGGNSYVISSLPALAGQRSVQDTFFDVIECFGSDKPNRSPGGKLDNILAGLACKAAIKSGAPLSDEEIDELLNQMARADLFSHCPHGRPVIRVFSPDELKKWFSRT